MIALFDTFRFINAALCLALTVECVIAIVVSREWAVRARFGALLGLAVVLTDAHLSTLGRVATWRIFAVTVIVALAVIGFWPYMRKARREKA